MENKLKEIIKKTALIGLKTANDIFWLREVESIAKMAPKGKNTYLEGVIFDEIEKAREQSMFIRYWLIEGRPKGDLLLDMALKYLQVMKNHGFGDDDLCDELEGAFGVVYRVEELEKLKEKTKDYSKLMNKLIIEGYITNVSLESFNNALNKGPIPALEKDKIIWTEKPAEAVRFMEHLNKDFDWWNNYFKLESGKRLNKTNRSKPWGKINEILISLGYE